MTEDNPLAGVIDILNSLNLDDSSPTPATAAPKPVTAAPTAAPVTLAPITANPVAVATPSPVAPTQAAPSNSVAATLFSLSDVSAPAAAPADPAPIAVEPTPAPVSTTESSNTDEGIPVEVAKKIFYDAPSKNVEKYCPYVIKAMQEVDLGDVPMLMMALGTIRAESASFRPISEYKSKYNTSPSGHPFDMYDDRKALGNRGAPDGDSFKGRGFIQLTGRANYTQFSGKLGLGTQLVDDPELANEPMIAARLLAAFIKNKETKIRAALADGNLKSARRYVNGGSHGLAQFSAAFNKGIELMSKS